MPINTKAKGTRIEHKVMKMLESIGYTCTRAGASLGVWDIVAVHPSHTRFIQVKANRRPGSVELEAMKSFRCPPGGTAELWVWVDNERLPRVEVL